MWGHRLQGAAGRGGHGRGAACSGWRYGRLRVPLLPVGQSTPGRHRARVRRCCGLRRRSAPDTGSPGAGGCRSKAVRKRCHGERAYSWAHARTQLTGSGGTATSGRHSQARQKAYSTDSKARPRCPVSRCVWWTRSGAACTYSASKAASGVDAARNVSAGKRGTTSGSTDWPSPALSAEACTGHRTGRSAGYGGGSFECSDLRMRSSPDLSRGFPTTDVHARNGIRGVPCTCCRGVMSRGRHPPPLRVQGRVPTGRPRLGTVFWTRGREGRGWGGGACPLALDAVRPSGG